MSQEKDDPRQLSKEDAHRLIDAINEVEREEATELLDGEKKSEKDKAS